MGTPFLTSSRIPPGAEVELLSLVLFPRRLLRDGSGLAAACLGVSGDPLEACVKLFDCIAARSTSIPHISSRQSCSKDYRANNMVVARTCAGTEKPLMPYCAARKKFLRFT